MLFGKIKGQFVLVDIVTDYENPSGSEYTVIPSRDISTNSQIDYSAVIPENGEIDPDNPDEYLKLISTPISPTSFSAYSVYT